MPLLSWMVASAVVSVAVIIILLGISRRFTETLNTFTRDVRRVSITHANEVKTLLEKELSPSIHLHDGPEAVASRMQHIIKQVADDPEDENRHITFYGAASLAAMPTEAADVGANSADHDESPSDVYWNAIKYASDKRVIMRRYISLFTDEEIRQRSDKIQAQYASWLKKQMQLLTNDTNYQLIDVPRAPQWGTNMARIIAKGVVMEITGNGRAAIVISDQHIAGRIRKYARDAITGKNVRVEPTHYGSTIGTSLDEFAKRIERVEAIRRAGSQSKG